MTNGRTNALGSQAPLASRGGVRRTTGIYVGAATGAAILGAVASGLLPVVIGAASLLPVFIHVRHAGLRRAITEPSPITLIVLFYFLVFPLRALVIATSGYSDLLIPRWPVSSHGLVGVLLVAAVGTSVFVDAYYRCARRSRQPAAPISSAWATEPLQSGVVTFAAVLACISLVGLVGIVAGYGGISAAQAALLSHTKGAFAAGASGSAWELFAVPAVWACACVVINRATSRALRSSFACAALLLLMAMAVIYGSRLDVVLALVGVWVAWHYSGRRVPPWLIVVLIPVAVFGSTVAITARGSTPQPGLSAVERYSRLAGYGVLDVSLNVWEQPAGIKSELVSPQRWLDLPAYFVPSFLWHGRPNLNSRRLDVYVAQAVGTANDQATGFPITYVMEAWLIGGWLGVVLISLGAGALLGLADRKLRRSSATSVVKVLSYAFLLDVAFTYYKDGDLLSTFVGEFRLAVYLGLLLVVTGVWRPSMRQYPRPSEDLRRPSTLASS